MRSMVTTKALEGRHEVLTLEQERFPFLFNPFSIEDSPMNIQFLKDWILFLIFPDYDYSDSQKQTISDVVDSFVKQVPKGQRQLSLLADSFDDSTIRDRLKLWCRPNKLGRIFDNTSDEFDSGTKLIGFNIDPIAMNNFHAAQAIIIYSMFKFSILYKDEIPKPPLVVAIDDANLFLYGEFFEKFLPDWLDNLTIHNGLALLCCDINNDINKNITKINNKISTYLMFPSFDPKVYRNLLPINNDELLLLKKMKIIHRNFMIKQTNLNLIVELNLDGLDYAIAALNGEQFAIDAMNKAINEAGSNPNIWIIPFYKYLFPNNKL